MSKHLFANEKVMTQYLGALLCEDEPTEENLEPVAKLLEQVKEPETKTEEKLTEVQPTPKSALPTPEPTKELEKTENQANIKDIVAEPKAELVAKTSSDRQEDYFDGEFQALFFEVAGLTLAVPLKALGGIHQLGEVNQLFGKPKWFKGVMLNREEKLNVVDTARWVMPEKYDEKLEQSLNYQYLITLGDSQWGLLAEKLVNNITLRKEDVKWRAKSGKRPWLAGVIKEKMCALIDVENLNQLLEQGLDSREQ
ncbi:chemotaxis protein CheW [Pseudoalteromonas shioyasakiensis]|uniref:chemotaxis protein CheW n=1 Tax=Pseudoalteromonas TaxID=53246 RepID=UPI000C8C29FC|nr:MULTISPECIES: chemotaxis protein CheW [Pseudoalteromonas]MAD05525.1 chemotaxis protein CheW [Pseudoalteromonas sp.]MCQ8882398.1 chemotaxis protein CheW [Pseudoalteromonas shioyasakiensis]NIZ05216.1 chemotaxis protein CheW [Pseudoalteromonas sp. HF66]RZD23432.1 chemotaxis protein CheW [Pseudoalteromonas sp. MEBiC 03485]|tara:strand:+ start:12574 stop:13332 length:759 start_codon:yes stop_codon:yes gene_type:complete|eukprot:gnl/Carplike_NY0171/13139_a19117_88.p1 GENE.gnl/Carplike_NY0171/13139_a19117_88~~gnl/Carplike_NY0171/13139_a19117_88.p1  ORF type:complete len:253 (-),score=24.63 gnl/Carplike_NY0171/13139_a19117_88:391-1149(-)